MKVAGLVLAAGTGRRYGMPKALVPWEGTLLVRRAERTLRAAGLDRIHIVVGAQAERVRAAVPGADFVDNPEWDTGMASSLRAGLGALAAGAADAAVVLLVDMPGITPAAVRRIAAFAAPDALAMGGYDNRRSHPVLLGRDHWIGVATSATGDRGARDYLRTHAHAVRIVPMDDIADDYDLDVPPGQPEPDAAADDEA